jgi:hypothetical protein
MENGRQGQCCMVDRRGTGWRMIDRVKKRRAVSKDNIERRTGTVWKIVDRERTEKKRVVKKDNLAKRRVQ